MLLQENADLTISAIPIPIEEAHEFGIMEVDENWKLTAFKECKESQAITEYSNDISKKNIQLSELTVKYEQLLRNFETNTKILDLTKQSLSEYMEKYTVERNKNFDLEDKLRLQQTNLDKVEEYLQIIEDYKGKEKQLEDRIKDLKAKCEKKGLDFETENNKYLTKKAEMEKKAAKKTAKTANKEEK